MLRWLARWLLRWLLRPASTDLYHPKERLIYSYFNGEKVIRADPLILERKLMSVGPELAIDIKVSRSISQDAAKSHTEVVKKIRDIFNVKPLEEGGLTEVETVSLLEHYLEYTDSVKKNSSLIATPAMETSVPSVPSLAGSPPTPSSSASGSTGNENSTDGPGLSPTEPELPKE